MTKVARGLGRFVLSWGSWFTVTYFAVLSGIYYWGAHDHDTGDVFAYFALACLALSYVRKEFE